MSTPSQAQQWEGVEIGRRPPKSQDTVMAQSRPQTVIQVAKATVVRKSTQSGFESRAGYQNFSGIAQQTERRQRSRGVERTH